MEVVKRTRGVIPVILFIVNSFDYYVKLNSPRDLKGDDLP